MAVTSSVAYQKLRVL